MKFTAVYKKTKNWYLGWVEEIPGVNVQGKTLKEVKSNLKDALYLVLITNRALARKLAFCGKVVRQNINPTTMLC